MSSLRCGMTAHYASVAKCRIEPFNEHRGLPADLGNRAGKEKTR